MIGDRLIKHSSLGSVQQHSRDNLAHTYSRTCGIVINGISEIRWYCVIRLVVHQLPLYGHLSECVQRSGYGHHQRRPGEGLQNTIGFRFSLFQFLWHTVRKASDRRSTLQGSIIISVVVYTDTGRRYITRTVVRILSLSAGSRAYGAIEWCDQPAIRSARLDGLPERPNLTSAHRQWKLPAFECVHIELQARCAQAGDALDPRWRLYHGLQFQGIVQSGAVVAKRCRRDLY